MQVPRYSGFVKNINATSEQAPVMNIYVNDKFFAYRFIFSWKGCFLSLGAVVNTQFESLALNFSSGKC